MAEYDLTQRVAPFFDLHLVIPLLEFIQPRKIYDDESLYKTHRSVLLKTNMIDSVIEMYPEGQCPEELLKRRDEVLEEREQLKAKCDPVVKILELDEVKDIMESARDREGNSKVLEFIEQNHGFKLEMLEYLFKYAKFQYECGNYQAASICLFYYRNVVPQHDPNYLNALYGKLASEILNQEWTHAKDDLTKLKAYIDSDPLYRKIRSAYAEVLSVLSIPINLFRNPVMRNFIHQLNPNIEIASSFATLKKIPDSLHEQIKTKVKSEISKMNQRGSIIADIWTDRGMKHSYIGFTLHFCDSACTVQRIFLGLNEIRGSHTDTEVELLQHRAWLLHWALFVYFNFPKGRDEIIEMFLNQQPYLNTIQILCPHLLRYLAVAVVTSKNKQKNSLKDLIRVIDIEKTNYRDPVTDFLSSLYIDYDFDGAQQKLQDCEKVLENDFFLVGCVNDFRESARLLVFDMFCRIHQCISLDMLSSRLFMDPEEAEAWIVDLIRNYRIEGAKIDSDKKQVVMGVKPVSIHEQVMENTKRLTLRSQQMSLQLEKLKTEKKGVWKNEQSH